MSTIEKIAKGVLGDDHVLRVETERTVNTDGEEVLLVRLVYSDDLANLSAEQMSTITKLVWESEEAALSPASPVIDFMTNRDSTELHAA